MAVTSGHFLYYSSLDVSGTWRRASAAAFCPATRGRYPRWPHSIEASPYSPALLTRLPRYLGIVIHTVSPC